MRQAFAVLLLTTAVAPLQAGSNPLPVGPQFQVNSFTTNSQGYPAIAFDPDGDFVVVWESAGSLGGDNSLDSAQGQRYSAAGVPQGGQFQVNSYTPNDQGSPAIASDADGDFVVVWSSNGSSGGDTLGSSVQGQRYSAAGATQGAEFQVNSYTTSIQFTPAIASAADGDFVVIWESYGASVGDSSRTIQGQRYTAAGVPQGAQFQVESYTTSAQRAPAVASDANGNFVVVWKSFGSNSSDLSSYSIQGQRYSAAGATQGTEFQVNSYTLGPQADPAIASDADGGFVVVWHSNGSSGGDYLDRSIQGQRFAAEGAALGAQFQVNSYTTGDQQIPAIATDADGDFIVVWHSNGSSGSDTLLTSVQGQRYSAAGAPLGAQFQVNSYTTGDQQFPAIATDPNGDFIVAWRSSEASGGDVSGSSVQAQRFLVTGNLFGQVFLDQDSDGIQDGGEPGIAGIAVELYDINAVLRRTAVTDGNGDYFLKPKEGSWTVKFVPPSNGFTFTIQDEGGDTFDSDADPTTGETEPFPMQVDSLEDTIDAGFLPIIFADGFEGGDSTAWSATVP